MNCKSPYCTRDGLAFGCGQCMPCRLNKRREWTHRMILEQARHEKSCFVTLTYADEEIPLTDVLGMPVPTLNTEDPKKWLKNLRRAVHPTVLRYYYVGEYGDESGRPHYHVALYGLGVEDTEIIGKAWQVGKTEKSRGFVYVGELTMESAQYVAGYVTKKMTNKDDSRLLGRDPEFARMSLKPGIGALAVEPIRDALTTSGGVKLLEEEGDVPSVMRHGGKDFPLGRYLRGKLRKELNIDKEGKAPEDKVKEYKARMLAMYDVAKKNPKIRAIVEDTSHVDEITKVKEVLVAFNKQKVMNLEKRSEIFKQRRKI